MCVIGNYRVAAIALMIGLLLPLAGCSDSEVDFSQFAIEKLLEKIDTAAEERDVDGLLEYLSEDVVITMTVQMAGRESTDSFTRQKYAVIARQALRAVRDYDYDRINTSIVMNGDGRSAVVESEIVESMTINGRRIDSITHETSQIEVRDNGILITAITGISEMR